MPGAKPRQPTTVLSASVGSGITQYDVDVAT